MEETIGCKTVQQLETFLQEEYHAQPVEPVDYLLYNARQQMLNLFYPQQMQQLAEQIGFGPESDEEICALFDCLAETFPKRRHHKKFRVGIERLQLVASDISREENIARNPQIFCLLKIFFRKPAFLPGDNKLIIKIALIVFLAGRDTVRLD